MVVFVGCVFIMAQVSSDCAGQYACFVWSRWQRN